VGNVKEIILAPKRRKTNEARATDGRSKPLFRPVGLFVPRSQPTAYAVGCILCAAPRLESGSFDCYSAQNNNVIRCCAGPPQSR
jgi:hypothetical protein